MTLMITLTTLRRKADSGTEIGTLVNNHDICKFLCENLRLSQKKTVSLQINLEVLSANAGR